MEPSVTLELDRYNELLATEKRYYNTGERKTSFVQGNQFGFYRAASDEEATGEIIRRLEEAEMAYIHLQDDVKGIKKMSIFQFLKFRKQ